MGTVENYLAKYTQWARDRNLIDGGNPTSQYLKLMEEHGEYVQAKANYLQSHGSDLYMSEMKDGLGDTAVVLTVIAAQCGINLSGIEERVAEPARTVNLTHALCLVAEGIQTLSKGGSQSEVTRAIVNSFRELNREAQSVGVSFTDCLEAAWSEIKDRKGRMIDGLFVKEEA